MLIWKQKGKREKQQQQREKERLRKVTKNESGNKREALKEDLALRLGLVSSSSSSSSAPESFGTVSRMAASRFSRSSYTSEATQRRTKRNVIAMETRRALV